MPNPISGPVEAPAQTLTTEPTSDKRGRTRKPTKTITPALSRKKSIRSATKTTKILRLLQRPEGASLAELIKATEWQAHSLRGFLSGVVKRKMRLKLASIKRDGGERAYRVASK